MPATNNLTLVRSNWCVSFVTPKKSRDKIVLSNLTEVQARSECKRLNHELNLREGMPDPRKGAFTYYYARHGNHHTGVI